MKTENHFDYKPRPLWWPLLPALSMVFPAMSLLFGGSLIINDFSWIVMLVICIIFIFFELRSFSNRFGTGGITFFGGVIIWFVADYLKYFFNGGLIDPISHEQLTTFFLAEATFYHFLFITFVTLALVLPWKRLAGKYVSNIIGTVKNKSLFIITIILFLIGISPFFIFTAVPWYKAIFFSMIQMRTGDFHIWTVARSGNLNYNVGGYVFNILNLEFFAGLVAACYALFLARNKIEKAIFWGVWLFVFLLASGSGTRSNVILMSLPVIGMMFIKYIKKFPKKAYSFSIIFLLLIFFIVQVQGFYRNYGFDSFVEDVKTTISTYYVEDQPSLVSESNIENKQNLKPAPEIKKQVNYITPKTNVISKLSNPIGNEMFSSSLYIINHIPDDQDFFYNRLGIEGLIRPIPQTVVDLFVGFIPRVLWHNKPINPLWKWLNKNVAGTDGINGTTLAQGAVGFWYGLYGLYGIIIGALLIGWFFIFFESMIYYSFYRPLSLLISLLGITFLFRTFRGFWWLDFQIIIIGVILLLIMHYIINLLIKKNNI